MLESSNALVLFAVSKQIPVVYSADRGIRNIQHNYTRDLRLGHRHENHRPLDHRYKCHENTNHSRVPQLPKAPIHTSKLKYVPNLLQA